MNIKLASRRLVRTGLALLFGALATVSSHAALWSTGYYAAWMQSHLPASQVDFTALTHVIHFAVVPRADGTLDSNINVVSSANSADVVSRAHAAGVKVLISIGGAGSVTGFRGASSSANLGAFINNIAAFMQSRGYDGVDLDWEPLESGDAAQFTSLVNGLRARLDQITPRPLLTCAAAQQPSLIASLQHHFDQVNLMTYDLSGPWPGWVTWFNSPVFNGGFRFPSTGGLVPSSDGMVATFTGAGVPAAKLGIGVDFYGYIWAGGSGTSTGGAALPRQSWSTAPSVTSAAYHTIMSSYHQPQLYFWDAAAQSAYLSIDQTGSANDKFISYDDETTCQAKVDYARSRGLGGIMIWELGGGYRSTQPAGQRDPLLQAIKRALGGPVDPDVTPPTITVTSPANGATVSGTVVLSASAADDIGVAGVRWQLDGVNLGAEIFAPPYSLSWNTTTAGNGSHSLTAVARDAAGNRTSASIGVTVSNPAVDVWIYKDALVSPWINTSWSASASFSYRKKVFGGSRSIQVVQDPWGALSLHSGSWSAPVPRNPSLYTAVSFAINGGSSGVRLGVQLENDANETFPRIDYGNIPANTWMLVSIPMSQLNPSGRTFHRVDIQDLAGVRKTYLVDEIRLIAR